MDFSHAVEIAHESREGPSGHQGYVSASSSLANRVQLQTLLASARTLRLPDAELALVDTVVKHLTRLLGLAEEIRHIDQELHRLAADLRTRARSATPGPPPGRP